MVLPRLDGLTDPALRLLHHAVAAGREFDLALMAELAGSTDGYDALLERGLLVEVESGRGAFRHALTREAIYSDISWVRRRALHRQMAERLQAEGAAPLAIAQHWLAAKEPDRARAALLAAAEHASTIHAYRDAADAAQRALELWPDGAEDARRLDVLDQLGQCAQLCACCQKLRAGERVLDVAAGNGNATLAAARRWGDVTSTDYVAALLERGRTKAAAEGLSVTFQEADAELLPFAERSFDVVLSVFGVMFTPNQEQAAQELLRVCRPGGKIGLANWTPEGFIGQVFRTIGKYIPPPAGVKSPALWGTEGRLRELFGDGISEMTIKKRFFVFRYRSAEHWLGVFRTYYGPVLKAFAALDEGGQPGHAPGNAASVAGRETARDPW